MHFCWLDDTWKGVGIFFSQLNVLHIINRLRKIVFSPYIIFLCIKIAICYAIWDKIIVVCNTKRDKKNEILKSIHSQHFLCAVIAHMGQLSFMKKIPAAVSHGQNFRAMCETLKVPLNAGYCYLLFRFSICLALWWVKFIRC